MNQFRYNPRRQNGIDLVALAGLSTNTILLGPWLQGDVLDGLVFGLVDGGSNAGGLHFDLYATREPDLSLSSGDGGHRITDRFGTNGAWVGFVGDGVGLSSGTERVPICYYFDGLERFLLLQWNLGTLVTAVGLTLYLDWHPGEVRPSIGSE